MSRFAVTRRDELVEIAFDDGGMNLLSADALRELRDALPSDARLLVFRSARTHIFAAGADMAEMERFDGRAAADFATLGQQLFAAIERLPFITVALIDGDCFGGALDLVLSFDLRFATPRSRFSHPGAKLGIVTGFGGTSRWRKVLAPPAARRLFLGNDVLSSSDALTAGLIDRVAESFDEELARLATLDPSTTRFLKELTRVSEGLTQPQVMMFAERLGHLYFRA
jgi:enoyl-CoA hydratase/carnithine racemase